MLAACCPGGDAAGICMALLWPSCMDGWALQPLISGLRSPAKLVVGGESARCSGGLLNSSHSLPPASTCPERLHEHVPQPSAMGDAPAGAPRRRTRRVLEALKCQVQGCLEDLLLPYHKVGAMWDSCRGPEQPSPPAPPTLLPPFLPPVTGAICSVAHGSPLPALQKYHVCATHFKLESLQMEEGGELVRFCQKCGRFQVPTATPRRRTIDRMQWPSRLRRTVLHAIWVGGTTGDASTPPAPALCQFAAPPL